jgi:hypothetical protein
MFEGGRTRAAGGFEAEDVPDLWDERKMVQEVENVGVITTGRGSRRSGPGGGGVR